MRKPVFIMPLLLSTTFSFSQSVHITVDASQNRKAVSPYIYGKNNSLSDDPSAPLSSSEWQKLKDAGITLFRENSGNNGTKYNWRLKLTSAPDWYNNVYPANWDYEATSLQQNIPGARGMFAFQLIGQVAKSSSYNFDDWSYNQAQWWPGVAQNLAGDGVVNPDWNATDALVEGHTNLYLQDWPADSTVAILDKWFGEGAGNLGLDAAAFPYWNMDNEPEIWESTHDDVVPSQLSAEAFMQRYFTVAKKARAKYPTIRLVGFVPCSEWYWYAYPDGAGNSGKISYHGQSYTWIEFFIKRIGEEQAASGIRLLDVIDLHTYLSARSTEELLQVHRVFYDETFDYPHANGVKLLGSSGWDESITKEFIFKRINGWLDLYLGENHGVTIGTTESGWDNFNQMPQALNYASTLGVFANEGVELFTPWYWSPSYWEVVHLFSRYGKKISVKSTSDDDDYLSAYATVSAANDSMTIVLVNRYASAKNATVTLDNFTVTDGLYPTYSLSNLPNDNSTETFISHTNNALNLSNTVVAGNSFSRTLPAYSISSVILRTGAPAAGFLAVAPTTMQFAAEAGQAEITIGSNVTWTAHSNQSWLTLNPTSGANNDSITVSAAVNPSYDSRTATITISGSGVTQQTIAVTQAALTRPITEAEIIYNDAESKIEATWSQYGTLAQITGGAFEGTKHYRFTFSFTNWWAGVGLNLTNFAGNGAGYDFTGYTALKFACKLTGSATATIILVDADGHTNTNQVAVSGAGSTYQEFSIPLSSFTGMTLDDVGEIMVNINGTSSSASGTFNIDNIRVCAPEIPKVSARLFLQGPFDTASMDSMKTTLQQNAHLPLTSPYAEDPQTVATLPAHTVDWVLVQLRASAEGPTLCSKSACLRRDGVLLDPQGNEGIHMPVTEGSYFLLLKQRNHLTIMSKEAVVLTIAGSSVVDFTLGPDFAWHPTAIKEMAAGSDVWAVTSGDINSDGLLNTRDYVLWFAANTESGYRSADIDLDGIVNNDDYRLWRSNSEQGAMAGIP